MIDPDELEQTLASLQAALNTIGVRWAIGGSFASATWGEPRATNDLDVVVEMRPDQARAFARELIPLFYADEEVAADAAEHGLSFNVIDQRSFMKIDVFVPRDEPMGTGQLDRSRQLELFPGRFVPVLGPEDTILQKLRWYEIGGRVSDRQWRDIVAILRLCEAPLDDAYLSATARHAGFDELLELARANATAPQ